MTSQVKKCELLVCSLAASKSLVGNLASTRWWLPSHPGLAFYIFVGVHCQLKLCSVLMDSGHLKVSLESFSWLGVASLGLRRCALVTTDFLF